MNASERSTRCKVCQVPHLVDPSAEPFAIISKKRIVKGVPVTILEAKVHAGSEALATVLALVAGTLVTPSGRYMSIYPNGDDDFFSIRFVGIEVVT